MLDMEFSHSLDSEPNPNDIPYIILTTPKTSKKMEVIHLTPQLWQTSQINELATALITFQSDFNKKGIKEDAKNPHLKNTYVSLDNLLNTVRPLLFSCGLVVTQEMAGDYLVTSVYHSSGQFKGSAMSFNPMAGNRGTNELQNIGGGITYAKRYAISALLGISVDTDDDGNGMKNKPVKAKSKPKVKDVKKAIEYAISKGWSLADLKERKTLTKEQENQIERALFDATEADPFKPQNK
jgi:hypothetical protein